LVRIRSFDPIDYLLRRKFPDYSPVLLHPDSAPFERTRTSTPDSKKRIAEMAAYKADLEGMEPAALQALVNEEKGKARAEEKIRAETEERLRFFNRPEATPDYLHWGRAAFWRHDEAVALALGKSPDIVTWENVKPFVRVSRFAAEYQRLHDLAERAQYMGQLQRLMIPRDFLAWAKAIGLSCPAQLVDAVTTVDSQMADWKSLYEEAVANVEALTAERDAVKAQLEQKHSEPSPEKSRKPLNVRERETLLKLIISMAIGGYGHDPTAKRTDTARDIVGDLAKNELSLDEDTVRNWLKKAREVLPGDWRPDNKD
jgi:hypothetical protein